jgi:hypothetical protein
MERPIESTSRISFQIPPVWPRTLPCPRRSASRNSSLERARGATV